MALQIGPDRAAADTALKALIHNQADAAAYQIAQVYALRNDPDDMFTWLEHAWDQRDPGLSNILMDPVLLRYKGDPRFGAFCRKLGLPIPDPVGSVSPESGHGPGSTTGAVAGFSCSCPGIRRAGRWQRLLSPAISSN
jgi:hypothetical protein